MAEDNGTTVQKWSGGTVLFAGGTDWSSIGRNIAGKKKGGADAVRAPGQDLKSLLHNHDAVSEHSIIATGGGGESCCEVSKLG